MFKTRIVLIALGCLALVGCDASNNTGADGYTFGEPQYQKTRVTVDVFTYNTRADFEKAFAERNITIDENSEIMAFSELHPKSNFDNCTIHMMSPTTSYQPEWIGHEFVHCVYGQWHTSNNSRQ